MLIILAIAFLTAIAIAIWIYRYTYEYMNPVVYLSEAVTRDFLLDDVDGYVRSLTAPDLYARKVSSHSAYRERIGGAAIDFSESQKALLDLSTEKADAFLATLKSAYIANELMAPIGWKFALTKDDLYEDGYPHTRADVIFISPSLLESNDLVKTLIHEKIHIYQRAHLARFQKVLADKGYRVIGERKNFPHSRANPDLDPFVYESPKGKRMIALYNSSTPQNITDTQQEDATAEHPFEEVAYTLSSEYES